MSMYNKKFEKIKRDINFGDNKNNYYVPSKFQFFIHNFKKNKIFLTCFFYLILLFLTSIFIVLFSKPLSYQYGHEKFSINTEPYRFLKPFERGFLFGTDELSRDFLVCVAFGTFLSLSLGLINCFSVFIGFIYGFVSGIKGKNIDTFMMYIVDVINSIPHTIIQIFFGVIVIRTFETLFSSNISSIVTLFILFLLFDWLVFVGTARNKTLLVKQQDYFNVSKSLGASDFFIIKKHLIINCIDILVLSISNCFIGTIISEAGLSYMGIGVKKPLSSLGNLIQEYKVFLNHEGKRYYFFIPMVIFVSIVLSLNLINSEIRKTFKKRMSFYGNSK